MSTLAAAPAAPGFKLRVALALGAVYVIWGSTYLAIRLAVETLPPFTMAGARFVVAGAGMYAWARARGAARPPVQAWLAAAVVGAMLLAVGNGGVVWAETRVPTALAALLIATMPLFMAGFRWAGGERPSWKLGAGLVAGMLGVGLLVRGGSAGGVDVFAAVVLLGAAASWAAGSLYAKRAPLPADPLLATALPMIAGGAILVVAGAAAGEWGRLDLAHASAASVGALLYLTVFGSVVAFTAYSWLLRSVPTSLASSYAFVNPAVAVALGWAFLGEELGPGGLAGGASVVVAVVLLSRR